MTFFVIVLYKINENIVNNYIANIYFYRVVFEHNLIVIDNVKVINLVENFRNLFLVNTVRIVAN